MACLPCALERITRLDFQRLNMHVHTGSAGGGVRQDEGALPGPWRVFCTVSCSAAAQCSSSTLPCLATFVGCKDTHDSGLLHALQGVDHGPGSHQARQVATDWQL
jgi:hypothetical protein